MKYNSQAAQQFLSEFQEKTYVDIFNIRSRVEQREWEHYAITDAKEVIFARPNQFPQNKNVLYIHIPFCLTRCDYCPYYSEAYNAQLLEEYLAALDGEIEAIRSKPYLQTTSFGSVYVGGGTPSILQSHAISRILDRVRNSFSFRADAELSFESNPASLTKAKIEALREVGFNRVSLGVQTFQPQLLKALNCAHTAQRAIEVIGWLRDANMTVNVDCIFGLVNQTEADVVADIDVLCGLPPGLQLTMFPLRIAEHTPLHQELEIRGGIRLRDHQARLLELDSYIEARLTQSGFEREECPMFYHSAGAPEHKYQSTETRVVGVGASAGTLLDRGESSNFFDVREYVKAVSTGTDTALSGIMLTQRQAEQRFVLYRILYMNRSLPNFREVLDQRFEEYCGKPPGDVYDEVLARMLQLRFATVDQGRITLTDRLWRILNKVRIGMPSIV